MYPRPPRETFLEGEGIWLTEKLKINNDVMNMYPCVDRYIKILALTNTVSNFVS